MQTKKSLFLKRQESYIGVLIDDLVTKGTKEPYRMFTSRAEHRLVLREDNAFERLSLKARDQGFLKSDKARRIQDILEKRQSLYQKLKETKLKPLPTFQKKLEDLGSTPLLKVESLKSLLKRPEISIQDLKNFASLDLKEEEVSSFVEVQIKYEGYIKRQEELIKSLENFESLSISSVNFEDIRGLSSEEREKLKRIQPRTLAQAGRISGVNPSALQALFVHVKKQEKLKGVPCGTEKSLK